MQIIVIIRGNKDKAEFHEKGSSSSSRSRMKVGHSLEGRFNEPCAVEGACKWGSSEHTIRIFPASLKLQMMLRQSEHALLGLLCSVDNITRDTMLHHHITISSLHMCY